MSTKEKVNNPFQLLKGEQLSSVTFVQDYLQLDFDGNRLTCFLWPLVSIDNSTFTFGQDQYRNKLCELIANKVQEIHFIEEIVLEMIFDRGSKITLALNPDNPDIVNGEIATFKDVNDNWSFF